VVVEEMEDIVENLPPPLDVRYFQHQYAVVMGQQTLEAAVAGQAQPNILLLIQ
jgi:hypothetical protein